ncbi:ATP-binding protein [Horticoccus sp. 23ND18S-11]|uniref:ATP-binding protein n=1 Tax=Horticoccus sp. 23ND18S-11 TaxID=3391832 RepID=UPI0039C9CA87
MNALLARQLRKFRPRVDPTDPAWQELIAAIASAYDELQQDRRQLEHTLEVVSTELTEANERLRRDSESQLASINEYYQQVLSSQQGMILCVRRTPQGFLHTLCRGELARRLDLTPERVEGFTVEHVAAEENVAEINAAYERAWSGQNTAFSYRNARTGVEVFALMRPRYEHGVVREVISSCVEITALKAAEVELRVAKERAEAADRAKSEFLAVMSHEIRTPLNAVLGFSNLLREAPLTPDQKVWAGTICTAGESLLSLIDDILDFSKIEAGQLSLLPETVSIPGLLDAIASIFQQRARAKGITLETSRRPDMPEYVKIDPHRLRQILMNLVGNALKFTKQGFVRVNAELVAPATEAGAPCLLRFTVADSGIGIPANRRARLFKPFSQVDSSTTRNFGGTGLGLAICERLAKLLGGDIGFESEPGRGSTFFFTVRAPIAELRPAAPPVSAETPVPFNRPTLRILVAEDQPENRMLIEDYLRDRGFAPDVVENGRLVIEAAKARSYDLILLDLLMPEVDGCQAAQAIRQHFSPARGPRIVALTANVFPEDRVRCREAGMDGLLAKPIDFKELKRVLAGEATDPGSQ